MTEREANRDGLSSKHPGRTKNQDDAPLLPAYDPRKEKREIGDPERTEGLRRPEPTKDDLKQREARRRGAGEGGLDGTRSRAERTPKP